jgi:hypothetical protein
LARIEQNILPARGDDTPREDQRGCETLNHARDSKALALITQTRISPRPRLRGVLCASRVDPPRCDSEYSLIWPCANVAEINA